MLKEIVSVKSIFWNLYFENKKFYLINTKSELFHISLEELNKLLSNNIISYKTCGSILLPGKDINNLNVFVRKDSEEYKSYINSKPKILKSGNIFLYQNDYSLVKYKHITTVYKNNIRKNTQNKFCHSYEKKDIALNLDTNSFEYICLQNVIDIIDYSEDFFEENKLQDIFSKLNNNFKFLYTDTVKHLYNFLDKNRFNVYSFKNKMSKKQLENYYIDCLDTILKKEIYNERH